MAVSISAMFGCVTSAARIRRKSVRTIFANVISYAGPAGLFFARNMLLTLAVFAKKR